MTTIGDLVREAGGVLHKRELAALGARDRDLTRAVRARDVSRARRGWYTVFERDDPRFVALEVGGRLTGVAALVLLGAWIVRRPAIPTVSVARNASRLRRSRRARVVYDDDRVTHRGDHACVDPKDALARALLEVDFEQAVALWDWALGSPLFDDTDLEGVLLLLPADARGVHTWADNGSESLLESIARVRLELAGYHVVTQHPLGDGRRTDLLVNGVVAIETDGREFHAETFEADRRKDLAVVAGGKVSLRLSWSMVLHAWQDVLAALDAALAFHRDGEDVRPRPRRHRARAGRRGRGRGRQWRIRPRRSAGAGSSERSGGPR